MTTEKDKRDIGMQRVSEAEDNHYDAIKFDARAWVTRQRKGSEFTGEEACAEAVEKYQPRNRRVCGPVMLSFSKDGLIIDSGKRRKTGSHTREQTVWRRC